MQKQAPNRLKKAYPGDFIQNIGSAKGIPDRYDIIITRSIDEVAITSFHDLIGNEINSYLGVLEESENMDLVQDIQSCMSMK